MTLRINRATTDRGELVTLSVGERAEAYLIPSDLLDDAIQPAKAISTWNERVADNAADWNRELTPSGLAAKLRAEAVSLRRPIAELIAAGVAATRQAARFDFDLLDVGEPSPMDAFVIQHVLSLPMPARIEFFQTASKAQLAALIRTGEEILMNGNQDPAIWQSNVLDRYKLEAAVDRFALQAANAAKPSIDRPFAAATPDRDAARRDAVAFLRNAGLQRAKIHNTEVLVQRVAVSIAILCDMPDANESFEFLLGNEAA